MKFETAFSCGDKAWVFTDKPEQMTIGHVRLEYTHSKGLRGGYVDPNIPVAFDNFKPKKATYREVYMCIESGIGSGTLWELGHNIFRTEAECIAANAERIEQQRKAAEEMRQRDLEYAQRKLVNAQREIERLSAGASA